MGLGVGVFNYRSDVSILKALSNRTALLVEVGINQAEFSSSNESGTPLLVPRSGSGAAIELGPRLRRFTRPNEEFSPYVDAFIRGSFSHSTSDGSTQREAWGTRVGVGFGVEYFLDGWHSSLAAHTEVLTFSYEHERTTVSNVPVPSESSGFTQRTSLSISPGLVLRVYF